MGNFPILDLDQKAWDPPHVPDLITVQTPEQRGLFTNWLMERFIPCYHNAVGKRFKRPIRPTLGADGKISDYSDRTILIVLNVLGTVVASVLPISSTVLLYYVASMPARLGIIAGFMAVFSLCLALATRVRRTDIFAATAALVYDAVPAAFLHGKVRLIRSV